MTSLSETGFLIDISQWAVQGHMRFVKEINDSIDQLNRQIDQTVKEHEANDQANASDIKGTLGSANSTSA